MLYTEKSGTSMFFNYIFLSKDSLKKRLSTFEEL